MPSGTLPSVMKAPTNAYLSTRDTSQGNPLATLTSWLQDWVGLSPVSQTLFPRLVVSLEEEAQVKPLLARLTEISRIEPGN